MIIKVIKIQKIITRTLATMIIKKVLVMIIVIKAMLEVMPYSLKRSLKLGARENSYWLFTKIYVIDI